MIARPFDPKNRSTLCRLPKRGAYDRETVYSILDEAIICHVGFTIERQPFVIPTSYTREGDSLYIHGSSLSRMIGELQKGLPACVTATLLDGIVLARSAFHHSMNYRSVVAFGTATLVRDHAEKIAALRLITEHVIPGRWREARPPSGAELERTSVVKFAIEDVSAKIRTGPPIDDHDDYHMTVWAGVIPLKVIPLSPVPDLRLPAGAELPDYVTAYMRGHRPHQEGEENEESGLATD